MEIDTKPIEKKTQFESPIGLEIIIKEDEVEKVERQEIPTQESIVYIQHFSTIETTQETYESIQVDPSTNVVEQFNSMRRKTTKNIQEHLPPARRNIKDKVVVLSALNMEENVLNLEMLKPKVKNASSTEDYKSYQIKLKHDQVSVVDKINLDKQT